MSFCISQLNLTGRAIFYLLLTTLGYITLIYCCTNDGQQHTQRVTQQYTMHTHTFKALRYSRKLKPRANQHKPLFSFFNQDSQLKNKFLFSKTAQEQWVNCVVQGQNNIFVSCQLGDSNFQPFGYQSNTLTTRLPCHLYTLTTRLPCRPRLENICSNVEINRWRY